jgi:hypothetical protein
LISGCTTKQDPDGHEGKEWCRFVEDKKSSNDKNWGYCSNDLDFD